MRHQVGFIELGREASVIGVAQWYRDLVGTLVVDNADAELCSEINDLGVAAVATNTIMSDKAVTAVLADELLNLKLDES